MKNINILWLWKEITVNPLIDISRYELLVYRERCCHELCLPGFQLNFFRSLNFWKNHCLSNKNTNTIKLTHLQQRIITWYKLINFLLGIKIPPFPTLIRKKMTLYVYLPNGVPKSIFQFVYKFTIELINPLFSY